MGWKGQHLGAESTAQAMQEMASGIEKVAEISSGVSNTAAESVRKADEGNNYVQLVIEQIQGFETAVGQSDESIQLLYQRVQDIHLILKTMKGIAEQTNLLALNASIEASRAGEQGKGFAVVASEIRKLAEQSRLSADQIDGLIEEVEKNSSESVMAMQQVKATVNQGLQTVVSTKQSFELLLELAKRVDEHVQHISDTTKEMSTGSEQVAVSMQQMMTISKETVSQSKMISTQSQKQVDLIGNIHQALGSLKMSSDTLKVIISKLEIDSVTS